MELPAGYEAADGFRQLLTLITPDGQPIVSGLGDLRTAVTLQLPEATEVTLSLTIGYCASRAKDVCYVDRAELTFARTQMTPSQRSAQSAARDPVILSYRPGAHL